MDISGLSQGRQLTIGTISSNGNNISSSTDLGDSNVESKLPVVKNENVSKETEHGEKELNDAEVKKAVDKINKFLQGEVTHVEYERHDKLKNEFIIRIVDNETKEVIKEIPPKKILDMVAEMYKLAGILLDEKA